MSDPVRTSDRPWREDASLVLRSLLVDLPNLSLLARRHWHAVLVTQHHSGTHWLIHMLTELMSQAYDVPGQADIDDMRVIVRHKEKPIFPQVPAIAHSHKIPSWLTHAVPFRWGVTYPRYVVLVRDIRASLVSLYEKHREEYNVPFTELVQADPLRRRFRKDIWRDIRFFNAWARVKRLMPERILIVRYEDLKADTAGQLRRVWDHLELAAVTDEALAQAVENSSKQRMLAKQDAQRHGRVVRDDQRHPFEWFSEADREYFTRVCRRHLRDWFGYEFDCWET
ncbi:MAG: sulfotransferase domain-containing protein [Phycisphaeraceae bacterium]